MSPDASNCDEGIKELAGRMILRAFKDLLHPEHSEEARAWFHGSDSHLTFQLCAHVLGFDEDALRLAILKNASSS